MKVVFILNCVSLHNFNKPVVSGPAWPILKQVFDEKEEKTELRFQDHGCYELPL